MAEGEGEDVYITLVMTDGYLPGAAVLAKSLRDTGTTKKLAVLIDQERLRPSTVAELQSLYDYTIPIQRIGTPNPANLYLMNRPDLLYTFTKINLFRLTQFRKILYLDADVVALRAPDELFALPDTFAAAPDVGWPDAFNTGVMLIAPHMGDYHALHTLASAGDSFDGADQGLLNQYFEHKPWKRLSFKYNCTPSANYQYEPAYRYYKREISLVHFIGSEKPWGQGRRLAGGSGAYQELVGRWWAVWDRHFHGVSTQQYVAGQRENRAGKEEATQTGFSVEQRPEALTTTEMPLTAAGKEAESVDRGLVDPSQTSEARRVPPPYMEWDATRAAPPTESKPEAANFPNMNYEFSQDPKPFIPPAAYPEPPKDMWYEVPKQKPSEEKLAPLFPWEEREMPKPSRRFVDSPSQPPPQPSPNSSDDIAGADEFSVQADPVTPSTPTIIVNDTVSPWSTFGHHSTKNAWDEVSGIEDYVRALTSFQKNRGKIQVLQHSSQSPVTSPPEQTQRQQFNKMAGQMHILDATNEPAADDLIAAVAKRRESLILTDFPTAMERPSLPVTPAPIRRGNFWGKERGEREGEEVLVPAEGVPDQRDWDPEAQLEELRRNSLLGMGELKMPARRVLPQREMVRHAGEAVAAPAAPATLVGQGSELGVVGAGGSVPEDEVVQKTRKKPTFVEPDFGVKSAESKAKEELAPTETS